MFKKYSYLTFLVVSEGSGSRMKNQIVRKQAMSDPPTDPYEPIQNTPHTMTTMYKLFMLFVDVLRDS